MLVNTGSLVTDEKPRLFYSGGLSCFLPMLESYIKKGTISNVLKEYLKLVAMAIHSKCYAVYDLETTGFFRNFFHIFCQLDKDVIDVDVIGLLANIRFALGEQKL